MKKRFLIYIAAAAMLTSCLNNDFMNVYPKNQQTEGSVFTTYDNFKTYSWGLYNVFFGYSYGTGQTDAVFQGDYESDNMLKGPAGNENKWAYGKVKAESQSSDWDYSYIRTVNLMLDGIAGSQMNEAEKNHWRSVGLFFRSYKYFLMMSKFGDIPWVDHVLPDNDPALYGARTPRNEVAENILNDLKWAEANIKPAGDGDNTVNRAVVQALISRFCLFEGTWRKYHNMADAEKYLQECVRVAPELLAAYPTIMARYDEVFNSENLAKQPGIILYKHYATSQLCHGLTRMVRTAESNIEATRDAVDSYLCADGRPYTGNGHDVYEQFRSRDYRLYLTICPPYKVNVASNKTTWSYTDNAQDREFIDLMAGISGETYHRLPTSNFKGFVCSLQPHFRTNNKGQAWNASQMGFWVWKYYNTHTDASNANGVCTTDAPLFRIEEVMLDYAEAMFELGRFDQSVADQTINKLRKRAHVADMRVADITPDFDPKRDTDVAPVLWEIRRERRVEFMGEGRRLDDLRRWHKGNYVDRQPTGVWVSNASADKVNVTGGTNDKEGYVYYYGQPTGWKDYYYLYPLPLEELALNKNLEQNPEWSKSNK